jgi:glutaredoxin-dependent peroxiredoxin
MSLAVGQKAPNFKLVDIEKKEVTLDEYKGKNVVLFFFPMAWTGVCTKEVCAVAEDYAAYEKMNAVPLSISVDSHFALKRFGEDNKISHKLLSDFNKVAIRDYDIVQKDFAAVYHDTAKRATFVLDKEGIIRFIEILPSPGDFPNMDAIKKAVAELK